MTMDPPLRTPEEEVDEALKALGKTIKEKFKQAGLGETVTALATVILAVAGVWGLVIYGGQLTAMRGQLNQMGTQAAEMQKQTNLMRQQMVGTQAAYLSVAMIFTATGVFNMNIINVGLVSATGVHIHGEGHRLRLSDGARIGASVPLIQAYDVIAAKDPKSPSWLMPWHPQVDNTQGWPAGWPGRDSFSFEGEITYQNGFGDPIRDPFCWKWLPRYTLVFKSGYSSGGGGGLWQCRDFNERVHVILEEEKLVENGADRPDRPL
jgi:hypothetical protein